MTDLLATDPADGVLAHLVAEAERLAEEGAEEWEQLSRDLRELDAMSLVLAVHDPLESDEAVRAEFRTLLRKRLARDEAVGDEENLPAMADAYAEAHGAATLQKALRNAIYEYFELEDHGLFPDDVTKTMRLLHQGRPGIHVRPFLEAMCKLSRRSARFILGLFPQQIELIYKIGRREVELDVVEGVFDEFAPKVLQRRVMAVLGSNLEEELRFRLTLILYARSRGYEVGKAGLLEAAGHLDENLELKRVVRRLKENADWVHRLATDLKAHREEDEALTELLTAGT